VGPKVVAHTGDIAPKTMIGAKVDGTGVLIANIESTFYAITSKCTHMGCNLSEGFLHGNTVTCPCHGSQFNVTNGQVVHGPAKNPERSLSIRVEDGKIAIDL
jgi:nitrite reductase/ring-hydroxylating ferredoxin subunit